MLANFFKFVVSLCENLSKAQKQLLVLLAASFIVRVIYVFFFTDYRTYLFSDMGGYWQRAIDRYNGDVFNYGQWASWAPFYHYYLAFIFELLGFLHLFEYKLEIVLFINILLSVVSVYFFYGLAVKIIQNVFYSKLATIFYAFSYPIVYLNTFVLSENLSIPLIIISISLLFKYVNSKPKLFFTGVLLAFSICARPALGLLVLPFFLYIVFFNKVSFNSFVKGLFFALGFYLVIALVIQENVRVSNGELKTLAGNGGLSFFIQQCKVQWVRSNYKGYVMEIGNPTLLGHPDIAKMVFQTDHSFHDQRYFYRLGMDCIRQNPRIWLDNLISLKALFIGPLFPSVLSCLGFEILKKMSDYIIIFTTPSLLLLYFLLRDKKIDLKETLIILSVPVLITLTNFIFAVEQRYLFPAYFSIYLGFFAFLANRKSYPFTSKVYLVLVIIFFLLTWK